MGTQPKNDQRCCLGLLYYSQALEEQGKRPVCLGLPHTPSETVHLESQKQLTGASDYKFVCLGHSMYDMHPAAQSSSSTSSKSDNGGQSNAAIAGRLPYCEGLEVILGSTADAAAAAATAGAQTVDGRQPTDELSAVLTSMFGGENSPLVKGAIRFNNTASRNWERMKSTANQAYSMTLKPLIDKLSGGQ